MFQNYFFLCNKNMLFSLIVLNFCTLTTVISLLIKNTMNLVMEILAAKKPKFSNLILKKGSYQFFIYYLINLKILFFLYLISRNYFNSLQQNARLSVN